MKPGGVVSLKRFNSFVFLRKNRLHILMCLAFVVGVITGSAFVMSNERAAGFASDLASFYIKDRQGVGFLNLLLKSCFGYGAVCLAFFVFGASVIGVVLSPVLCCAIGLYYGSIAAYLYSVFSVRGVAFNAIVLIPATLVFAVSVFFAAKESFCFSAILLKLTLPKSKPVNVSAEFKAYCGKFLAFLLVAVFVSIIDAAVSTAFLKLFDFDMIGGAIV